MPNDQLYTKKSFLNGNKIFFTILSVPVSASNPRP